MQALAEARGAYRKIRKPVQRIERRLSLKNHSELPHCLTPRLKHACTYTSTTRKPHHRCLNSHPPHTKFRIFVRVCLSKFFLSQCFVADKDREEEHLQRTEKGKKKKKEKSF